jgi:hypothetical protein
MTLRMKSPRENEITFKTERLNCRGGFFVGTDCCRGSQNMRCGHVYADKKNKTEHQVQQSILIL